MNEDSEILLKISRLKKENKNLQDLLENAENEMKGIVEQSQEESKQLQKALQSIWPKIQLRLQRSNNSSSASTASVDRSSKAVQTENSAEWNENLQELENYLKTLEKVANEMIKTQNSLQADLQAAKKNEGKILEEVTASQQQILNLEIEISEYKKQLVMMQDEFLVLYQNVVYENSIGNPIPSIFLILNT